MVSFIHHLVPATKRSYIEVFSWQYNINNIIKQLIMKNKNNNTNNNNDENNDETNDNNNEFNNNDNAIIMKT